MPETTTEAGIETYSQVGNMLEMPSVSLSEALSGSEITLHDVDRILRDGGNKRGSAHRIAARYSRELPQENTTAFLSREYAMGGKGMKLDGKDASVWFDETGMTLAYGNTAKLSPHRVHLSWEQVDERVRDLVESGGYIGADEIAQASDAQYSELANALHFFYRDSLRDYPQEWKADHGAVPGDIEKLVGILKDPEQYAAVMGKLETDIEHLRQENPPRQIWHNPERILDDMRANALPPRSFPVKSDLPVKDGAFITDDEVDAFLVRGGNIDGGKNRIFSYFLHDHTPKERTDLIKNEYGNGGGSHALSGADDSHYDGLGGKLTLARGGYTNPYAVADFTWSAAAARIDKLIREGRYMNRADLARLPEYEKRTLARQVHSFYYNLPADIARPFPESGLFMDDAAMTAIREKLDDPAQVAEMLATMRPIYEATHESDRYFATRKTAFDNLTAYHNGTFTLFPGVDYLPDPEMSIPAVRPVVAAPEQLEQLTLFPLEQVQREIIAQIEAEQIASEPVTITDADMDDAIIGWNGDPDSIGRVRDYMALHARERGTAEYLCSEYGGNLGGFIITKDGAEPIALPWPKVQRRVARLMDVGAFIPPAHEHMAQQEPVPQQEPVQQAEPPLIPVPEQTPEPQSTPAANYRITDDHLGEGGQKTKYAYNAAAIRVLKQIEAEGRQATAQEQETLARYVGWGGIPQAFDPRNDRWTKEYAELKGLLSDSECESAMSSVLNAHYTSPTVIRAIYEAVQNMGFTAGNILEPACGVGNFFGLLPVAMAGSKLYGVELDSLTGRIAKQLYPSADITIDGFENTAAPDAFFDLAIGNVPFGNYKVPDKKYDKHNLNIHDYFFYKALDKVRPGGVVAFITTNGTLDKRNPTVRRHLAERADLLGAIRLPNNAFKANAGTDVTTDILFLQKRDAPIITEPDWVHLGHAQDGVPVNRYFVDNPHMMLGTMEFDDSMYDDGKDTTCRPIPGADLAEQLSEAVSHIRGEITEAEIDDIEGIEDESIPADPDVRNFSYTVKDDTVYFRENSRMHPVYLPAKRKVC